MAEEALPFDDSKYYASATKGDVAGVALKVSMVAMHTAAALAKARLGEDISEHVTKLKALSDELDAMFDQLTGYTQK